MPHTEHTRRTYRQGQHVYWTTGETKAVIVKVHNDVPGNPEYSILPDGASVPTRTRAVFLRPLPAGR